MTVATSVTPVQKEAESTPLLVDVLNAVSPISDSRLSNQSLTEVNGVVLLVTNDKSPKGVKTISSKSVIQLGDVIVDDPNSDILIFEVTFYNESERPSYVEFHTSCGCIQPKEPAIVIEGKSSYSTKFLLSRGGWGLGNIERFIDCVPKNGPSVRVSVKGNGLRREKADHGISVSTQHLMFYSQPYTSLGSMKFAPTKVKVQGTIESLRTLNVISECDWAQATKGTVVTDKATGVRSVTVDVNIIPDLSLFEKLKNSTRQCNAILKLSTNDDKAPTEVKVTLVRPALVKAKAGTLSTTDSEYSCQIELFVETSQANLEILEFSALGQPIPLSLEPSDRKHRFVISWPRKVTHSFSGIVKLVIGSEWVEEVVILSCGNRS